MMGDVFAAILGAVDPAMLVLMVVSFIAVAWWAVRRPKGGDGGNDAGGSDFFGYGDENGDGDGGDGGD